MTIDTHRLNGAQPGLPGVSSNAPTTTPPQKKTVSKLNNHYGIDHTKQRLRHRLHEAATKPSTTRSSPDYGCRQSQVHASTTTQIVKPARYHCGRKSKDHLGNNMKSKRSLHFFPKCYMRASMSIHVVLHALPVTGG